MNTNSNKKQPYVKPELKTHGSVEELTQGINGFPVGSASFDNGEYGDLDDIWF